MISEFARLGWPKLDMILQDEVSRLDSPMVVACCGLTMLNAIMQKHVTAQINPGKIWHGDK